MSAGRARGVCAPHGPATGRERAVLSQSPRRPALRGGPLCCHAVSKEERRRERERTEREGEKKEIERDNVYVCVSVSE